MAPEIYADPTGHGIPSEWFSMGVALHEFVLSHKPFESAENMTSNPKLVHLQQASQKLSQACRDIIAAFLRVDPFLRPCCEAEVKDHPWFAGFDWSGLAEGSLTPPFIPDITIANCDTGDNNLMEGLNLGGNTEKRPSEAVQKKFEGYNYNTDLTTTTGSRRRSSLFAVAGAVSAVSHSAVGK
jgi:serine/threonine protein kinase